MGCVVEIGGSNVVEYVYRRRTDDATLDYGLVLNTNLLTAPWINVGHTYEIAPTASTGDPDIESVTNHVPITAPTGFFGLEVIDN